MIVYHPARGKANEAELFDRLSNLSDLYTEANSLVVDGPSEVTHLAILDLMEREEDLEEASGKSGPGIKRFAVPGGLVAAVLMATGVYFVSLDSDGESLAADIKSKPSIDRIERSEIKQSSSAERFMAKTSENYVEESTLVANRNKSGQSKDAISAARNGTRTNFLFSEVKVKKYEIVNDPVFLDPEALEKRREETIQADLASQVPSWGLDNVMAPGDWLDQIAGGLKSNDNEMAVNSFAKFKDIYPDYPVSSDILRGVVTARKSIASKQ